MTGRGKGRRRRRRDPFPDIVHAHCECVCSACGAGWIPGRSAFHDGKDGLHPAGYTCACGATIYVTYVTSRRDPRTVTDPANHSLYWDADDRLVIPSSREVQPP